MSQQKKARTSNGLTPAEETNESTSMNNSFSNKAVVHQTAIVRTIPNESAGPAIFSGDSFVQMSTINPAPEDENTAEEKKNISDIPVANSSRSVRQRKKRNFEEFYTFENSARDFVTSTPMQKTSKKTFVTSTPMPETVVKKGRGRPRKLPDASSVLQHLSARSEIIENGSNNFLNEDSLPSQIIRQDSQADIEASLSKERLPADMVISVDNQVFGKKDAKGKNFVIPYIKDCTETSKMAADCDKSGSGLKNGKQNAKKSQAIEKDNKSEEKAGGVGNDGLDNVRKSGRPRKKRNYAELAHGGGNENHDSEQIEERSSASNNQMQNPSKRMKKDRKESTGKDNDNADYSPQKDVMAQVEIVQKISSQENFSAEVSVGNDVQPVTNSNEADVDVEENANEFNGMRSCDGNQNASILSQGAQEKKRPKGRPCKSDQSKNNGAEEGDAKLAIDKEGDETVLSSAPVKKRGRPPKTTRLGSTPGGTDPGKIPSKECGETRSNKEMAIDGAVLSPAPVRKRGRPPKITHLALTSGGTDPGKISSKDSQSTNADNATQVVERFPQVSTVEEREGPSRNGNTLAKEAENHSKSTSADSQVYMDEELTAIPVRKRGRPPKTVDPAPKPEKKIPLGPKDMICKRCGEDKKTVYSIQRHMMIEHSLWWSRSNPMGEEQPAQIIKVMGYIDCKKCGKRFRFAHYYRHHQVWCGRETELATCDKCNKTMKAMWLQQHLAAHKTKEKQMTMNLADEDEKDDEEEEKEAKEEEGKGVEGTRGKRKAAKSAIKLLSSFQKDNDDGKDSSGDEFKENVDEEESSDDNEGEDENEESETEKESEEEDTEQPKNRKNESRMKDQSAPLFKTSQKPVDHPHSMLALMCSCDVVPTIEKRLKTLEKFFISQQGPPLFTELCPRKEDWQLLSQSDANKFLPASTESVHFTGANQSSGNQMSDEFVLSFGQSATVNGKSYSFTGNPIWSMEWCPLPERTACEQIVAVSTDRITKDTVDSLTLSEGPGLIQLWGIGPVENKLSSNAEPKLLYCIAHEAGQINGMSWCSRRCFDETEVNEESLKRLGLLAVACSNGSVLVFSLPQPASLLQKKHMDKDQAHQIKVFQPTPCLKLVPNSLSGKGASQCMTVSWQQTGDMKYIIAGYRLGTVYLWDIQSKSPLVKVDSSTVRPLRCFKYHNKTILSTIWNPKLPNVFVSTSFDSVICMWDATCPDQPISILKKGQSISISRSLCWAGPMNLGIFAANEKYVMSEECPVHYLGLARSCLMQSGRPMLILNHTAPIWKVSYCPYYDVLYSCDATGKVKVTLPPMPDIRAKLKSKYSWYRWQCPSGLLYQAKIKKEKTHPPSEPTASKCVADKTERKTDETLEFPSKDLIAGRRKPEQKRALGKSSEDVLPITSDMSQVALEDLLQFEDCKMERDSVRCYKSNSLPTEVVELEDFGGNNINAIHNVQPNPHPSCCLWVASGGQSGLLRLDNVSSIIQPHCPAVKEFYVKKNQSIS